MTTLLAETEIESLTRELMATRNFIADLGAFIRFAQKHGKSDAWTLGNIAHDVYGAHMEGLSDCFSPRCTGFAQSEIKS